MKLIGTLSSPYTRKARVVLAEKRIDYDFEIHGPSEPGTRVPEFNPIGKVPVLVMDDGTTIFDSRVIVEYLDGVSPVTRLIPETSRQRIQVRRWEALADGLLDAAVLTVNEGRRPKPKQSMEWIERQMGKVDSVLRHAAAELEDRPWCYDEGFSLADIALGCALGYLDFRFPAIPWRTAYPNLERHAEKLFKRPSFEASVPVG
ncbi:MAG: glutathione S-transferase N-terminal domain-containing protein [Burkholderiales bacterium]|nr:glutathione S-transferase N-terminal domain-containing protein [Burkholderiales bacterium]